MGVERWMRACSGWICVCGRGNVNVVVYGSGKGVVWCGSVYGVGMRGMRRNQVYLLCYQRVYV